MNDLDEIERIVGTSAELTGKQRRPLLRAIRMASEIERERNAMCFEDRTQINIEKRIIGWRRDKRILWPN